MVFPRAIGKLFSFLLKLSEDIISERYTSSLLVFGISIPTVFFPGITDTLVDIELVWRAISSDKLMILETFTPGAGSNSYKVTTGPLLIFLILPWTPKSRSIFSKKSGSMFLAPDFVIDKLLFFSKREREGNLYLLVFVSEFLILKLKDCCFSWPKYTSSWILSSSSSWAIVLPSLIWLFFTKNLKIFKKLIDEPKIKKIKVKKRKPILKYSLSIIGKKLLK